MKYIINKTNYCDFNVINDHALEPRSYFIPYKNKDEVKDLLLTEERYKSSLVELLNGEWDFKYYENPNDLEDEIDTDSLEFDKIPVPSCYQFYGYGKHMYLNVRYPFPCKPPFIPTTKPAGTITSLFGGEKDHMIRFVKPKDSYNSVALYRRKFNVNKISSKMIISFLGVAPCLDLYINGKYVGYDEESHNTSEFDITSNLVIGENEILVVTHRWCNGSYLECQDMFRNNGIFRDVLLRKEELIKDYVVKTNKVEEGYELEIKVETYKECKVHILVEELGIDTTISSSDTYKVTLNNVKEWNAEYPNLYKLFIEASDNDNNEVIRKNIGFKNVKIVKDKYYFNDTLIKFKGTNHHDSTPHSGYYMTPSEIENDLKIIKEYNMNGVRTSHYPPDPLLIDLCNELGLYIILECDIETHGCLGGRFPPNFGLISNNPKWEAHYISRAKHMFERDKNNVCIALHSMGNEAGGDYNFDKMYEYLHSVSNLPVHYEGCVHSKRIAYDVGSQMYPHQDYVRSIGDKTCKQAKFIDRPYMMCEYVHAMGVGPGGVEEYWESIYKYDSLMGGFVWEFADHAILHEDGSYTYGGDHEEYMHDDNFCCDGMFYPDRSPSTGAKIMKFVYRPLRFTHLEGNKFEIFNTNNFTNASEYKVIAKVDNKDLSLSFNTNPFTKEVFELDVSGVNAITFNVYKNEELLSEEYIELNKVILNSFEIDGSEVTSSNNEIKFNDGSIKFEGTKVIIDYKGNILESDNYNTLVYRAHTDNDISAMLWTNTMKGFYNPVITLKNLEVKDNVANATYIIQCKKGKYQVTDNYEVSNNGEIKVTSSLDILSGSKDIGRFAKTFKLDKSFENIEYLGRRNETYIDMRDYSPVEVCSYKVKEMTEPNIRPQESGNRMDCRYMKVTNNLVTFNFIALNEPFELGVKPYFEDELIKMKHREDEIYDGTHILINKFNRGIGTAICGPAALPEYCYKEKHYTYSFVIKPE